MCGYSSPSPAPAQPLATRLCGLGPECRLFPVPIPLPGASSWGGTRPPLRPPPPMGPPPGSGSWQPAGGSLSMLHLFIDRALPQLLFQSPASCRRLIREGGAGSQEEQGAGPRAVTQGWEGTQRACLPAQLPFLSPECSARPCSWELWRDWWSAAPLEGCWARSSGAPGSSCRQECPGRMKHLPIALVPAAVA